MTLQNRKLEGQTQAKDAKGDAPLVSEGKKKFVEPEISQPVDVLEATTFFQTVDSGPTN